MVAGDPILIGASWYPEMWPDTEWPKDIARMRELGFRIVRLFEFAWHKFEPREGQYDFTWARRCLDQLHAAGIQVMLGTPTAAPPAWLTQQYPEVLQTHYDGRRATHGQRKHYNHWSQKYRQLGEGITLAMAKELGYHPAIHSWQIDNEMSGDDFGPETHRQFHRWLEQRYGTIENLNQTWGLEFWSQAYNNFDQIPMVKPSHGSIEVPERHHPSLIMALTRFMNEGWTQFIAGQCAVIRQECPNTIITSNMTPGMGMNWFQHNKVLDRVGHSLYRDVDHYHWNPMYFDRMRAEKGQPYQPYYQLETAPNWSAGGRMWNIHHSPAGIRAFSWLSLLLGGSMILYWQWRSHWAGQEMQHGTHVTATGNWAPNKDAIQTLCADTKRMEKFLAENPPAPAGVGIMMSNENAWGLGIDPIDDDMRYDQRWRDDYQVPLVLNNIWRDTLGEDADLTPYKVVIMPLMPMVSPALRQRLVAWVKQGGCLLLGPLTGYRSTEFTAFTDRTFGGLEELIGAESALRFTAMWVEKTVALDYGFKRAPVKGWCEAYAPTTGHPLAQYRGGYGDGLAGVMDHNLGQGRVLTMGCRTDEATYLHLVKLLMTQTGLTPLAQTEGRVIVAPRANAVGQITAYGLINLEEERRSVTLPAAGMDLFTGLPTPATMVLEPLAVHLVKLPT